MHRKDPNEEKGPLKSFLENVSVKGVPKITTATSWCQRGLWLLALLLGSSVALYQTYSEIARYLTFSSSISVSRSSQTAPFPDVTICNLNPLWPGAFRRDYNYSMEDLSLGLLEEVSRLYDSDMATASLLLPLLSVGGYIQNLNITNLMTLVNETSDFVLDCSWLYLNRHVDYGRCESSIKLVFTPSYGPCFTFQNNKNSTDSRALHEPIKLTTILYLDNFQEEMLGNFFVNPLGTYANGAKVLVHPRDTFPLVEDGVNVSPGTEVTFRLEAETYELLGEPYSSCTNQQKMYTQDQVYQYSASACNSLCWQEHVLRECGCLDFRLITLPEQMEAYEFCGRVDHQQYLSTYDRLNCSERVLDQLVQDTDTVCNCNKECKWILYDTDVYQAPWPHEAFQLSFYYNLLEEHHSFAWRFQEFINESMELFYKDRTALYAKLRQDDIITRNFLQVNVELVPNATQMYSEVEVVSFSSTMGTVGGILNLWVGITFITFIEVVDLVYCLTCSCTKSKDMTRKRSTHIMPHNATYVENVYISHKGKTY